MANIESVVAYEVLDSRGFPTVEVEVTSEGHVAKAMVPSGASTGVHEALELRDADKSRYCGKGVLKAVDNVNNDLSSALIGQSLSDLSELDKIMIDVDGSDNKMSMGANAILGCSMALARLKALVDEVELREVLGGGSKLPVPMMNVVNGGAHADNILDFQEFMIVPAGFATFSDALRAGAEIYQALKVLLKERKMVTAVGDEGGFAPDAGGPKAVLGLLMEAIESAGYKAGEQVWLAMDVAASEFYKDGKYELVGEGRSLSSGEMVDYYEELVNEFPLFSIEDGMDEDDFEGWKLMQARIGDKVQIVGDDLFVTNMKRLQMGFDGDLANSILIKLNQIGSLKETLEVIAAAKEHGYTCVVSHRSGETEDSFIADLAVGIESGQIKTGAPCRSDRVAKYNQLIRLERALGDRATYAGLEVIKNK